jgi:hypothetical protein
MNRSKWILALVAVALIGSTALVLARYKTMQRLGEPGVVTRPIPGALNVEVVLPEKVLDYTSELLPQAEIVTNVLPKDTSYGQRRYMTSNHWITVNTVLMGSDRASLHKPQYCLTGSGWMITRTEVVTIPMEKPKPYDLSVIKLTASTIFKSEGREQPLSAIYVYWYVSDNAISADPSGADRMWSMARRLISEGILERWAYVTYFAPCEPGREDETFERVKKLIVATVPEFQIPPASQPGGTE